MKIPPGVGSGWVALRHKDCLGGRARARDGADKNCGFLAVPPIGLCHLVNNSILPRNCAVFAGLPVFGSGWHNFGKWPDVLTYELMVHVRYVPVNHCVTLISMETLKITCPNCGHDAGQLTYEADRRRNLPPLAPLPDRPILNGPDPQIFGSWLRDSGTGQDGAAGVWHRPADLHHGFRQWWVTEGGAPFAMPSQRRMSAALVALGWTFKKTGQGRLYTPPPPSE